MMAWGNLALGEIYLTIGDGRSIAAGLAQERELLRACAAWGQAPRAQAFEAAVQFAQKADTAGMLAQALTGLGGLTKFAGHVGLARGYLEEARAIAEGLNAEKLIQRIDAML